MRANYGLFPGRYAAGGGAYLGGFFFEIATPSTNTEGRYRTSSASTTGLSGLSAGNDGGDGAVATYQTIVTGSAYATALLGVTGATDNRCYVYAVSSNGLSLGTNTAVEVTISVNNAICGYFSSAGFLGLNTTSPGKQFHTVGDGRFSRHDATAGGADLEWQKSRGTESAPSAVQNGDALGNFVQYGYNAAAYRIATQITAEVDGVPGATQVPGRMRFLAATDTVAAAEKWRYDGGGIQLTSSRLRQAQGASQACANDITLGSDGNLFLLTGNTNLQRLATAGWQAGSVVWLQFSGTPTVVRAVAGGGGFASILLTGGANLVCTANTLLGLVYDGTNWNEIARSAGDA